ncbi:MAG: endo alpha-1,4 polygalactosaminidase [Granulosicoccus sp.]
MHKSQLLSPSQFKLFTAVLLVVTSCTNVIADDARWKPALGASWWWQIENSEGLDVSIEADMFDIDLFDGAESGKIADLRDLGKRVVCYFSAGTYEPWRPDASRFTADSLISESNLPQFDDEVWLDIGNQTALENVIKPIMQARLDFARTQGCDGVEPDNVDGYSNSETQGRISAQDQLAYSRWLAQEAQSRGMSVGLKNDVEHLEELVDFFDFAVNEQCFAFGNECTAYESTFLDAGKPVFAQEYGQSGDGGQTTEARFINEACPYFQNQYISALWKQTLNLDGQGVRVCELDTTNLIPDLILKQDTWAQITLPADPGSNSSMQAIVDELPAETYDEDWVVYGVDRSDSSRFRYIKVGLATTMNLGEAYWIVQSVTPEVIVRMPVTSQATLLEPSASCVSSTGCFGIPLLANSQDNFWNMLGSPINQPANLSRSRVVTNTGICADGCTLAQAKNENIMNDTFFHFDGEADDYRTLTGTDSLQPWEGAWVEVSRQSDDMTATWLVAP